MVDLLILTSKLNGAVFGNIYAYANEQGEVSDYHVNLGMNYGKAKADDFVTVCNADIADLVAKTGYSIPLIAEVVAELKASKDPSKPQTTRGKAQSDAYTVINSSLKIHNESKEWYIFAYVEKKTVLIAGEYGADTRSDKTKCKRAVEKALKLKTAKYKQFKVTYDKFTALNMMGEVLIMV